MPTTFRRTNTDSGLGGGQDFNKAILDPTSDTTGSQVVSVGANSTRDSFGYTDVGVPGADGVTGDYTVEMEVITAQNDIQISCAVARVNSSGTQQAISAFASEMQATAGTHTFNFTSVDLGTWASGDRLRVTYRYRNTHSHTARDIEVNHGGANNEVVAPWTTSITQTLEGTTFSPSLNFPSGTVLASSTLSGGPATPTLSFPTGTLDQPAGSQTLSGGPFTPSLQFPHGTVVASISIVGTPQAGGNNNGGNVTLTFDSTPQEGDVVVLFGGNGDSGGSGDIGPSEAGYTQQALRQTADEAFSVGVWTKVLGATPDSSVTGLGSGVAQEATAYLSYVLRGVDETTPMDATPVETDVGISEFPDLNAITTVTDEAWVLALLGYDNDESVWDAFPSGYTNTVAAGGLDTRRCGVAGATKEVVTAGTEDPGAFDTSDGQSFDCYGFTVAVRPAATSSNQTLSGGAAFAPTLSFPTGSLASATDLVGGAAFSPTLSFPQGTVQASNDLVGGAAFAPGLSFPQGALNLTLSGGPFTPTLSFPQGTLIQDQFLQGSVFTPTLSFPQGNVDAGAVTQTLSGTVFTPTLSFPQGSVDQTVSGAVFTPTLSFPTGTAAASNTLTGTVFTPALSFPQGTASLSLAGQVFTPTLSFPQGSLAQDRTLTGSVFTPGLSFPAGTIAGIVDHLEGNTYAFFNDHGASTADFTDRGFATVTLEESEGEVS